MAAPGLSNLRVLLAGEAHLSVGKDGAVPLRVRRTPQKGTGTSHAPPLNRPSAAIESDLVRKEVDSAQEVGRGGSRKLSASLQGMISQELQPPKPAGLAPRGFPSARRNSGRHRSRLGPPVLRSRQPSSLAVRAGDGADQCARAEGVSGDGAVGEGAHRASSTLARPWRGRGADVGAVRESRANHALAGGPPPGSHRRVAVRILGEDAGLVGGPCQRGVDSVAVTPAEALRKDTPTDPVAGAVPGERGTAERAVEVGGLMEQARQ